MTKIEILIERAKSAPSGDAIVDAGVDILLMLINKNIRYGNSALDPVRIFSSADTTEQIRVRIDDKLSRLMQLGEDDEDAIADLIGYLILLRVATS